MRRAAGENAMKKLRICLLLPGLTLLPGAAAPAQEISVIAPAVRKGPAARERDIRRFLAATQVVKREMDMLDLVVAGMKKQAPQIPEKTWEEVKAELKKVFTPEMIIAVYVKIYARRFSDREMRQMVVFFESPAGRKLVEQTPGIALEAFAEGAERGFTIADKIQELLKSRGYNVPVT